MFTNDPFGNLSKSGTITFPPTSDTSTNRASSLGSYDANGNPTNDRVNACTWDSDGNSILISSTYANLGLTFDAPDRMAEQNHSGSYPQIVCGPTRGNLALMNRQALAKGFVPLSGGDTIDCF